MVLFLVGTALALVLRYWGAPLVVNLEIYHLSVCTSDKCLGIGGVNRISFALFVFFFLHAVVLKFVTSCSRIDSQSWWTKLALFIVLLGQCERQREHARRDRRLLVARLIPLFSWYGDRLSALCLPARLPV